MRRHGVSASGARCTLALLTAAATREQQQLLVRQAEVSKKGKSLTFPSAQPWDRQPWQLALSRDSVAIRHMN